MQRKKVLFIDDDSDIHDIVKLILDEDDVELISITDFSAISSIPRLKPDVILLDEWLQGTKGSDICTELKSKRETAAIPVVLVSAVNGLEWIARRCRANAWISKPFDIEYFKTIISAY